MLHISPIFKGETFKNFRKGEPYMEGLSNLRGHLIKPEGASIKYVGGGAGGFYKFFKKNFIAQETMDVNISWPSNFFRKCFMAPPFNFSFLSKAYL